MKVSKKYAAKYLRVEDLQAMGGEIHVVIDHVDEDVVMGTPKVEKDVLHFVGDTAPLVLSPTNARILGQALGDDSDGWGGANAVLCVEDTTIPWIKIRVPSKPAEQGNKHDEANPPPFTAGSPLGLIG